MLPVDRHLVGPLLESMEHELVCRGGPPAGPPPGGPTPYAEAVRRAVAERHDPPLVGEHVKGVAAPAAVLWDVITGLGGDTGWYTVPGAWALRGGSTACSAGSARGAPVRSASSRARRGTGGGSRRSSRAPGCCCAPRPGMPGTARLELRAEPDGPRRSRYVQRVLFTPDGLAGSNTVLNQ